jgi:hypothetical protein
MCYDAIVCGWNKGLEVFSTYVRRSFNIMPWPVARGGNLTPPQVRFFSYKRSFAIVVDLWFINLRSNLAEELSQKEQNWCGVKDNEGGQTVDHFNKCMLS